MFTGAQFCQQEMWKCLPIIQTKKGAIAFKSLSLVISQFEISFFKPKLLGKGFYWAKIVEPYVATDIVNENCETRCS